MARDSGLALESTCRMRFAQDEFAKFEVLVPDCLTAPGLEQARASERELLS